MKNIAMLSSNTRKVNMAMNSWEVSDAFWSKVEPLIPRARRDSN